MGRIQPSEIEFWCKRSLPNRLAQSVPQSRALMIETTNAALAEFEAVSSRMAQLVEADSIEGRRAILAVRKENLASIEGLHQAVSAMIDRAPEPIRSNADGEFGNRFHEMHRIVTLHQGQWPAVLITGDPEGFTASARRARQAKTEFLRWLRSDLLPRLTIAP